MLPHITEEPVYTDGTQRLSASQGLYPGHKVLAVFPFYNEELHLLAMVTRLRHGLVDKIVGLDNGSTDNGPKLLRDHGIEVLPQPQKGVGACLRAAIEYGRKNGFDTLVVMAGNNKDDPEEIPKLLDPILQGKADYVQGSRFLTGGASPNLPIFRRFAILLLSAVFRTYTGKNCSDLTNGFRSYRLALFDDSRINIRQEWLDTYEFEYYVHWKVHQLAYRVVEVPVTKTYPKSTTVPYTKVRPILGWWRMLRPFLYLWLRIKS